jgi:hypothetical protein
MITARPARSSSASSGARVIRAEDGEAERDHRYMWSNGLPPTQHRGKPRTFEEHPRIGERIEDGKLGINRYGKRDINARLFHRRNTICFAFKSLHRRT